MHHKDQIMEMLSVSVGEDWYRAVIVYVIIFFIGFVISEYYFNHRSVFFRIASSFIVGTSLISFLSIGILLLKIKYNLVTISIASATVFIIYSFLLKQIDWNIDKKTIFGGGIVVLVIAVTSLVTLPNIVSNDTLFFNEYYGYWIANEGYLVEGLAGPINSTGLSLATLCALLSLCKIHNMYQLLTLLRICVLVLFFDVIRDVSGVDSKRKRNIIGGIGTVILLSSPPFTILSSYMLSNNYWMILFMLYVAMIVCDKKDAQTKSYGFLHIFLIVSLAFTRIESIAYVLILLLVSSVMEKTENHV